MRGFWLSRSQAIFATGGRPYYFDKMSHTLNRRGTNSHNREFFVPEFQTTEQYRSKNIPVQEQTNSDVLDQLVANVDFNSLDDEDKTLNRDIKKARLGRILVDTKLQGQRLQQRKKELFNEWSQTFFESFSNHFGKLKNCLVQMHLNQDQIAIFNETLDKCLQNMQLDLNTLYNQFKEIENEHDTSI